MIRLAVPADLSSIAAFDEFKDATSLTIAAQQVHVATDDRDLPLAYALFNYTFYWRGYVAALVVHPDHRRRGLASSLLRHLESICTTPKIFISTSLCNIPMQTLLTKHTYRLTGVIENLGPQPELVYFKSLLPPNPQSAIRNPK